jgi:hypothetical protein
MISGWAERAYRSILGRGQVVPGGDTLRLLVAFGLGQSQNHLEPQIRHGRSDTLSFFLEGLFSLSPVAT